ncbi:hypothetical protein [Halobacterium jilantaiense]|uniref:DUF8006 domain-containing protein n=1 Tax=Halobacterium jilantaiense TaxID=355548 RepID=A0A1I0Q8M9_9EURY|nr:hypothetical protein [Halobacterium jilantaiense]SEW23378.1 hypothetical protein SAMN04487945_2386 [Halobacterium jilantaiense]
MLFTPLPIIDDFLANYHLGQVLVLLLVLSVVGTLPLGSRKVVSANGVLFGLLLLVVPETLMGDSVFTYRFLGIALLVVAPILYVTAKE